MSSSPRQYFESVGEEVNLNYLNSDEVVTSCQENVLTLKSNETVNVDVLSDDLILPDDLLPVDLILPDDLVVDSVNSGSSTPDLILDETTGLYTTAVPNFDIVQECNVDVGSERSTPDLILDEKTGLYTTAVPNFDNVQEFNVNEETGDFSADSDQDPDYIPDPEISCSLSSGEDTSNIYYVLDQSSGDLRIMANQNIPTGRPKKGRKKKYCQSRKEAQLCRNSNKSYVNYKGSLIQKKPFKSQFDCKCANNCKQKVSDNQRHEEFKRFWELGSYNAQTAYIGKLVKEVPKKRCYGRNTDKRKFTRIYNISDIKVCRSMFCNTLNVCPYRITTALNKCSNRAPLVDQRGKNNKKSQMSADKLESVKRHISSIPKYMSHYARSTTDARYLPQGMTLIKMYENYKENTESPVSFSFYKKIFYSHFNLRFKPLKKDTCNVCDSLKVQIDNEIDEEKKEIFIKKRDEHHELANKARNLSNEDLALAKTNINTECLTFDMQKTLPLPKIPTNIVFYKRQLWLYNLGIHSGKTGKGFCYTWLEGMAGKGAQEIGSALLKHVEDTIDMSTNHLILWCDSCGGQNRNIKLTMMMKALLHSHPSLQTITIRFLVSGHSFLPNDKDFGDIECALKNQERMYVPNDYLKVMKTCRKKNQLIVKEMTTQDFFGTELLEKAITNRKIDVNKEKINWFSIRQIIIRSDEPYLLHMFYNFDDQPKTVDLERKVLRVPQRRTVRQSAQALSNKTDADGTEFVNLLSSLWPKGKPIAEAKLDDLKSMMHLIPSDAKPFYENLRSSHSIIEDVDGFNGELDFDIEENV